ncbi:MAG: helix-turn-helix domain-containing protein [Armatimonadota bacterium]
MAITLHASEYYLNPQLPIAVVQVPGNKAPVFAQHRHDFAELAFILGGSATHYTDDETYPISAGDIFLVQGKQTHGFRDARSLLVANLLFQPEQLELPWGFLRTMPGFHALFALEPHYRRQHSFQSHLRVGKDDLAHLAAMVTTIERELTQQEVGFQVNVLAQFCQLLVYSSRCYTRMTGPTAQVVLRLGETLSRIEREYMEPLPLDELARTAYMSESTFLRVFKQATGVSPVAYIIRLRIHKAMELLLDPMTSITEVAVSVGFSDSNYFARQFKAMVGVSPRSYRKQHLLFSGRSSTPPGNSIMTSA